MSKVDQPQLVSAAEVSRNFGMWQDRTSQSPLIVTHHGRPRIAMVAIETYEALASGTANDGDVSSETEDMRIAVLAEHLDGSFVAFDKELRFTRLNSEALIHFDKPASALLGRTMSEIYPKSFAGPVIAALKRAADGGEESFLDAPSQIRPDRLLRLRIFPYPGGVAATFRNVAHEVQNELDGHEQQALYAARDAHGGVAVVRLSLRGTLDRAEPVLARIAGFEPEQLRGIRLTDLLVAKDRSIATAAIEAVLARAETRRFQSELLIHDGSPRCVCIAIAPIHEGFGITGAMMMMTVESDD